MEEDTKVTESPEAPVEAAAPVQAVTPNPEDAPAVAPEAGVAPVPPVPPVPEKQKPTMIVQFDGVDSGHIEMRMIGFDPRFSNPLLVCNIQHGSIDRANHRFSRLKFFNYLGRNVPISKTRDLYIQNL